MNVFSYFKTKNELQDKINFLIKVHKIEDYSVFLGLSYVKQCKKVNPCNINNYTLCAIILANKYLNDYNFKIIDIINSIDIKFKEYKNIELDLLNYLDWDLSPVNKNIPINKSIECW